jgi:hypothetical protein
LAIWDRQFDFDSLADAIELEKEVGKGKTPKKRNNSKKPTRKDAFGRRVLTSEEMKPTTIHSLTDFLAAQKQHQANVAAGMKPLVVHLMRAKGFRTIDLLALRLGIGRQHLGGYLAGKKLVSPVVFNLLSEVLDPDPALLVEMRALYIDAAAGHQFLNLTLEDLENHYSPDRQRRLTSWLMALTFARRSRPKPVGNPAKR